MPRRLRLGPAGVPQHIVQRGNNRQHCFETDKDFKAYAHWLIEGSQKLDVQIHAWVLMTNHVHLLATPLKEMAVARMMQFIGRHYVRYFNNRYQRSGTLWEGRYHSCVIQEETYLLRCQRYIELNPVRAGIVKDPADYSWSSYPSNGLGKESNLATPHSIYLKLGKTQLERLRNYRELFNSQADQRRNSEIRYALNKGLVLGNDKFKDEIERLTGKRVRPRQRGRPPK